MSIQETLTERNKTHGDFSLNANVAQRLKLYFQEWGADEFDAVQREALDLIATKLSRIFSGGENHIDNWHDIAGYSMLVEQHLTSQPQR